MRARSSLVVSGVLAAIVAAGSASAQPAKPYGAASPQEVVAGVKKAIAANDVASAVTFMSPEGLKQIASDGVTGVIMIVALADPDDPMPGGPKLTATELATKRKNYKEAVDLVKQVLKPAGLDTLVGKPPMSEASQKAIAAALAKTDTVALTSSLFKSLEKVGPLLGMTKNGEKTPFPIELGEVTGYKVSGDKATAKHNAETVNFVKIDGRWYLAPETSPGGGK